MLLILYNPSTTVLQTVSILIRSELHLQWNKDFHLCYAMANQKLGILFDPSRRLSEFLIPSNELLHAKICSFIRI